MAASSTGGGGRQRQLQLIDALAIPPTPKAAQSPARRRWRQAQYRCPPAMQRFVDISLQYFNRVVTIQRCRLFARQYLSRLIDGRATVHEMTLPGSAATRLPLTMVLLIESDRRSGAGETGVARKGHIVDQLDVTPGPSASDRYRHQSSAQYRPGRPVISSLRQTPRRAGWQREAVPPVRSPMTIGAPAAPGADEYRPYR